MSYYFIWDNLFSSLDLVFVSIFQLFKKDLFR